MLIVACSAVDNKHAVKGAAAKVQQSKKDKAVVIKRKQPMLQHIHAANKCSKSIVHTHPNGDKDHEHSCTKNMSKRSQSNAHRHKANNTLGYHRHVHPGGNKRHSHHHK